VSLKNVDTGFTRSTVTDSGGRYSFNAVPPTGRWTLSAELPGFGTQNREGLEFQANTRPEINFQLSVGGIQESITVSASSPLVRTRESELSSILDAKQVDALPTNGRNFLSLLQTSGSVVPTGAGSANLSVNGQGTRMANFVADGVSMTGPRDSARSTASSAAATASPSTSSRSCRSSPTASRPRPARPAPARSASSPRAARTRSPAALTDSGGRRRGWRQTC
jgi:hypothetical protein